MTDQALPLARSSDLERFVITRFASDLGFPSSLCALADGSILVATTEGDANNSPFGTTQSHLVRLSDGDANGVSDGSQSLATLPGFVTSLRRIGDLIIALSSGRFGQQPIISFWRTGSSSSDPLQEVGRLTLQFPADYAAKGGAAHTSYALAVRYSQNLADTIELYFNIGSLEDNASTDPGLVVGLSAAGQLISVGGKMTADSIQRVLIKANGEHLEISAPITIATGVRNASGMDFDAHGNLYFEDNGFSKDPATNTEVQDISFSSDELNYISASELGAIVPDFGFAESYTRYSTGGVVNAQPQYRNPVVSFVPLDGQKSEGAVEISMAPIGFPGDYLDTVFTNFFGKFGVGSANNDENSVVVTDLGAGSYFHFIDSRILGNPSGLLATPNALYIADFSSLGIFRGSAPLPGGSQPVPADQAGVIYRVSPVSTGAFVGSPSLDAISVHDASIRWKSTNDAISALELWGGTILAQAPRQFRVRPLSSGPKPSDFEASVLLKDLDASTTYSYRVLVGDQWTAGSFTTQAETPAPTVTITGIARQGELLTAETTLADGSGIGAISYRWQRRRPSGSYRTIAGATASTYRLVQADVGRYLRVVAKAANGQTTVTVATSAATATPVENVNDLPTGTVTLTGIARQGELLTATNTLADVDGLGAIRYLWQRSSSATGSYRRIRGATGSTYQLVQADVGKYVRVLARYIDRQRTVEVVPSAATAAVGTVVPAGISIAGQPYANLRAALSAAVPGSSITLAAGTYNITKSDSDVLAPAAAGSAAATLTGTTTPGLTIRGAGAAETRIIGNPRIHALQNDGKPPNGMVIRDLTLMYGAGAGGYIFAPSSGSIPYDPDKLTIDGFSLIDVTLVGSQSGGINGTYMDITGSRDVLFDGITVDLQGQSGYDPATGEGGGFLLFNEGGRNLQIRDSVFLEDGYSASVITLFTPDTIIDGNRFVGAGLIKQDDGSDPQNNPRGERFYNAGGSFKNNHLSAGAFLDYFYVFADQGAVWLDYLAKAGPVLNTLVKDNTFDILSGGYGVLIRSDQTAAKLNSYLSITGNTFNNGVAVRSDLLTPSDLIFSANRVNSVAFDRLRVGGAADDVINPSPLGGVRNWISGGDGNDTLHGSEGGFDAFVFWAPLNSSTNLDRIINFQKDPDPLVSFSDKIWLEDATFQSLASSAGVLSASSFSSNASGSAAAAGLAQITYNTSNGMLAYDKDGAGGQAPTPFAVLAGNPAIAAADLLLF